MSLILMKKIFESLPKNQYWSIHLLEYKHLKGGSKYTCRLIELEPDGRLKATPHNCQTSKNMI